MRKGMRAAHWPEQLAVGIATGLIAQVGNWMGDAMPARYMRRLAAQESGPAILPRRQERG